MIYPVGLDAEFDFGKHRGNTVEFVCDEEPTYIEWCIDNVRDFELTDESYEYYQRELEDYEDERGDWGDINS